MKKNFFFFAFIGLMATNSAIAQFDTEFWFATPYVNPTHDFRNEFRFVFSSSDQPTTITITRPADSGFTPIIRNMAANATMNINLSTMVPPISSINVNAVDAILNHGYKITASTPVFCYYEIYTPVNPLNNEIFSLKGRNALGTDFLIPMQNFLRNNTYSNQPCWASFMVLATEDNTEINITPTRPLLGRPANQTFTINLNAGQYYVARAIDTSANNRPVGTEVTSNKKVAITYSDDSMSGTPWGGCSDIGGDQIVPINMLGTKYIAVQGYTHYFNIQNGSRGPYDEVFILSTENNNRIRINGSYAMTLNRGETHRYSFTTNPFTAGSAVFIESNDPVYVSQLSGFGCEVGYSILPPLDCTGSRSVSVTRSTALPFYLTLLTEEENIASFTFNGETNIITAADFKDVPATEGKWKFAQKLLSTTQLPVNGIAKVENSSGLFHLGLIHGNGSSSCKFGYFSDFSPYAFKLNLFGDTLCEGQTLEIFVNPIEGADFRWEFPDGTTSSLPELVIPNAGTHHSGPYIVSGSVKGCSITPDTVHILVKPTPMLTYDSVTIFKGETYDFYGTLLTNAGIYEHIFQAINGCDSIIELTLVVNDNISISGKVMRQNQTFLSGGLVSLYKIQTLSQYTLVESLPIESDGSYLFTDVQAGSYIIKAVAQKSENALNTYYGNTEMWSDAAIVSVGNNSLQNINITIIPLPVINGNSTISGYVSEESGRKSFTESKSNQPAPDVTVYLQQAQNDSWKTVAQTLTDQSGYFEFLNIPAGRYRVILDIPGLEMKNPREIELGDGEEVDDMDYTVTEEGIESTGVEQLQMMSGKLQVYPNPTTGEIRFTIYDFRFTILDLRF